MLKLIKIIIILLATGLFFGVHSGPVQALPGMASKYYCLVDAESGQIILSSHGSEVRPMASTTKMMTAVLVMEYADLNQTAAVSVHADRTPEYTIGLKAGQQLKVNELLKAAMIKSANDAAVVLAEYVAGDEEFFAHLMSVKAFLIGASLTHFKNASGLPNEQHFSTAYDLSVIGRYAMQNEHIRALVGAREDLFSHPSYAQPLIIKNTNSLLTSYQGADGIKTGTTNAAGKCLIASATRNNRRLIAVVLNSSDRNGDCRRLLDYGFQETRFTKMVDKEIALKDIVIYGADAPTVELYPARDVMLWTGPDIPDIQKKIILGSETEAPLAQGQKLGFLELYTDGELVDRVDLITGQAVNKTGFLNRILKAVGFGLFFHGNYQAILK